MCWRTEVGGEAEDRSIGQRVVATAGSPAPKLQPARLNLDGAVVGEAGIDCRCCCTGRFGECSLVGELTVQGDIGSQIKRSTVAIDDGAG